MKKIYMLLAAVLLMVMTGCGGGDDSKAPPSTLKAITAFKITSPVNATGVITEATHIIAITVPYGTVVTELVPAITHTGASISPASGVANNFTTSKTYTVTAADASTQDYIVTVTVSPRSGSLDPAFGTSGMVTTTVGSGNSQVFALGIQLGGKIVAAGSYCISEDKCNFALVRYNADGTLDKSGTPDIGFGTTGIVTTSVGSVKDEAYALVIQPDGKIVVAGASFNSSSKKYDFALVRYNADGSLDKSGTPDIGFGTTGIVTTSVGNVRDYAKALRIQPNNKIVVAGVSFNSSSKKYDFALVRYNADGTLDKSGTPDIGFGTTGIVTTSIIGSINDFADDLRIQSDNKIVVAGSSNFDGDLDFALVRYNEDGTRDTGFGSGGIVTTPVGSGIDYAHTLVIQPSGNKIVLAGSSASGSKYNFALVRYNADGSLDTSGTSGIGFGTTGIVTTSVGSGFDSAYALGIDNGGKILAAGYSDNGSNFDFALVRYNTDGSPDTTFGTFSNGIVTTPIGSYDDVAFALVTQPDDSIVLAGSSYNGSNFDFALVRYLASELTP